VYENDPKTSWRNSRRIQFIKGIYQAKSVLESLFDVFERTGRISHSYIDRLLERHLRVLKDLSHVLYRVVDEGDIDRKQQRLFDKILGELWHELAKARDNARLLEAYETEDLFGNSNSMRGLRQLDRQVIAAARRDLPVQIRRARRLLARLIPLFEEILPLYKSNETFVRTLYFARDFFDKMLDCPSTEYFFGIMFPGGVGEGYEYLGESLERSQHLDQARELYEEAVEHLSVRQPNDPRLEKFRRRITDLSKNHERLPDFPVPTLVEC